MTYKLEIVTDGKTCSFISPGGVYHEIPSEALVMMATDCNHGIVRGSLVEIVDLTRCCMRHYYGASLHVVTDRRNLMRKQNIFFERVAPNIVGRSFNWAHMESFEPVTLAAEIFMDEINPAARRS